MRRFQTPLLHFLRRRGFSADAEDLTQETFLRAYENLHRYNRRWAFSTWLFTIARRTSLNHRRRTRPTADTRMVEAVWRPRPPLENMVAAESRRRLWDRAAAVLSEEQTTALWLHYVEEMPAGEIARVLGRSWASVEKVLLFLARKRLSPLLAEFVPDLGLARCGGRDSGGGNAGYRGVGGPHV